MQTVRRPDRFHPLRVWHITKVHFAFRSDVAEMSRWLGVLEPAQGVIVQEMFHQLVSSTSLWCRFATLLFALLSNFLAHSSAVGTTPTAVGAPTCNGFSNTPQHVSHKRSPHWAPVGKRTTEGVCVTCFGLFCVYLSLPDWWGMQDVIDDTNRAPNVQVFKQLRIARWTVFNTWNSSRCDIFYLFCFHLPKSIVQAPVRTILYVMFPLE